MIVGLPALRAPSREYSRERASEGRGLVEVSHAIVSALIAGTCAVLLDKLTVDDCVGSDTEPSQEYDDDHNDDDDLFRDRTHDRSHYLYVVPLRPLATATVTRSTTARHHRMKMALTTITVVRLLT